MQRLPYGVHKTSYSGRIEVEDKQPNEALRKKRISGPPRLKITTPVVPNSRRFSGGFQRFNKPGMQRQDNTNQTQTQTQRPAGSNQAVPSFPRWGHKRPYEQRENHQGFGKRHKVGKGEGSSANAVPLPIRRWGNSQSASGSSNSNGSIMEMPPPTIGDISEANSSANAIPIPQLPSRRWGTSQPASSSSSSTMDQQGPGKRQKVGEGEGASSDTVSLPIRRWLNSQSASRSSSSKGPVTDIPPPKTGDLSDANTSVTAFSMPPRPSRRWGNSQSASSSLSSGMDVPRSSANTVPLPPLPDRHWGSSQPASSSNAPVLEMESPPNPFALNLTTSFTQPTRPTPPMVFSQEHLPPQFRLNFSHDFSAPRPSNISDTHQQQIREETPLYTTKSMPSADWLPTLDESSLSSGSYMNRPTPAPGSFRFTPSWVYESSLPPPPRSISPLAPAIVPSSPPPPPLPHLTQVRRSVSPAIDAIPPPLPVRSPRLKRINYPLLPNPTWDVLSQPVQSVSTRAPLLPSLSQPVPTSTSRTVSDSPPPLPTRPAHLKRKAQEAMPPPSQPARPNTPDEASAAHLLAEPPPLPVRSPHLKRKLDQPTTPSQFIKTVPLSPLQSLPAPNASTVPSFPPPLPIRRKPMMSSQRHPRSVTPPLPQVKRPPKPLTPPQAQPNLPQVNTTVVKVKQETDEELPTPTEDVQPERKLVTSACARFEWPEECLRPLCVVVVQSSANQASSDFKQNRRKYYKEKVAFLKTKGLAVKKSGVLFRDDGMVLEWVSPHPVWSDTFMPDQPTDLASAIKSIGSLYELPRGDKRRRLSKGRGGSRASSAASIRPRDSVSAIATPSPRITNIALLRDLSRTPVPLSQVARQPDAESASSVRPGVSGAQGGDRREGSEQRKEMRAVSGSEPGEPAAIRSEQPQQDEQPEEEEKPKRIVRPSQRDLPTPKPPKTTFKPVYKPRSQVPGASKDRDGTESTSPPSDTATSGNGHVGTSASAGRGRDVVEGRSLGEASRSDPSGKGKRKAMEQDDTDLPPLPVRRTRVQLSNSNQGDARGRGGVPPIVIPSSTLGAIASTTTSATGKTSTNDNHGDDVPPLPDRSGPLPLGPVPESSSSLRPSPVQPSQPQSTFSFSIDDASTETNTQRDGSTVSDGMQDNEHPLTVSNPFPTPPMTDDQSSGSQVIPPIETEAPDDTEDISSIVPLAQQFILRYMRTFDHDRSLLDMAYTKDARFSATVHSSSDDGSSMAELFCPQLDYHSISFTYGTQHGIQQGRSKIVDRLNSLGPHKFDYSANWKPPIYDLVFRPLCGDGDGPTTNASSHLNVDGTRDTNGNMGDQGNSIPEAILLAVHSNVVNTNKTTGEDHVLAVDQTFVLRKPEDLSAEEREGGEFDSVSGFGFSPHDAPQESWPLLAISHQMVVKDKPMLWPDEIEVEEPWTAKILNL